MSEWLRRQTRNLLGFACAGSNPAVDDFFYLFSFIIIILKIGSRSVFADGVGPRDPSPLRAGLGVQFLPLIWFGDGDGGGGGCMDAGAGTGMLKPAPDLPVAMSTPTFKICRFSMNSPIHITSTYFT
ncbi:hypothetical protein MTR_3g031810 [Medicago truncatula]|uniref:Uncharacterized protein n=1 Tax=Medicago truncatula TaxID=3880 RepID=G7J0S3_MEDTR|nr:hypothetical protein MTR_3g031810 [Medicago truncatula]